MSFRDTMNRFFVIDDVEEHDYDEGEHEQPKPSRQFDRESHSTNHPPIQTKGNLVALNNNHVQNEVIVIEPRIASEVESIADTLLKGKIVLVNFRKAETLDAQKMIDYLNGVVYAIHGNIQRVGEEIFVLTPSNVKVDGDELLPLSK